MHTILEGSRSSIMNASLREAVLAVRSGRKLEARRRLIEIVKLNRGDAHAWFLLAYVVETKEQCCDCLERVLTLDPTHTEAQRWLASLKTLPLPQSQHLSKVAAGVETEKLAETSENLSVTTRNKALILSSITEPAPKRPEPAKVSRYTHSLWQIAQREPVDDRRPDTLQFLFDDIATLPILTNPHQELWLGVHLQAAKRFQEIRTKWQSAAIATSYSQIIWDTLFTAWCSLEQQCFTQDLPAPKLDRWASELLSARRNVYALRRSRVRRFIRRLQSMAEKEVAEEILAATYAVAETLAVLPGETILKLIKFFEQQERPPELKEMQNWLPVEAREIEQQVKLRTKQTIHTLTTGYLRYALRMAQGYVDKGLEYADLVQAGLMGLMRAAERFDYRIQVRFGAYATSWIWQAIGREIADQGRMIRLPVHVHESLRKWEASCEQFDQGRDDPRYDPYILFYAGLLDPDAFSQVQDFKEQEISWQPKVARQYEQAVAKARRLSTYSEQVVSLSQVRATVESDEWLDFNESALEALPDGNRLLDNILDAAALRQVIEEQLFPLLKKREVEVLELRFGLVDGKERSLKQVGVNYGLTRERIRQIEARAFDTLQKHIASGKLSNLRDLLIEDRAVLRGFPTLQVINSERLNHRDHLKLNQLNTLLNQLPRSHWHEGQSGAQSGERREQLVTALEALSATAHVADIAEQLNGTIEGKELEDAYIYTLLSQDEKTFMLLGQGIFSLVKWEQARAKESQPILDCCPMPLPDPPDYEDAFFESVLVGQQMLTRGLTAGQFVRAMLDWAKADPNQQNWFSQTILSAYYLVDLIPYVFYFGGENPVLPCTLPPGNIQDLRYHCLAAVTERLAAMPEFWWLFQQRQPARPTDLGELFADIHPNALDDVLHRLRLLASLGAAQKLKYGAYRLTTLGEECATRWRKEAIIEQAIVATPNLLDDFASLITW
jgi:RNA polymerase primary sigma factor